MEMIPSQLRTCPYYFTLTLPTFSSAAYGMLLLASRQAIWTTNIHTTLIPHQIPQSTRQALLQQMPTTIGSNTKAPKLSRDTFSITNTTFTGHTPTECYRFFKASALHTTLKLITTSEYIYQHERPTSAAELSPPLQALLQVLNAVQPATAWTADGRANTASFTPVDVDYNPLRLQSMPCVLYLTHPESPSTASMYLIRPPPSPPL